MDTILSVCLGIGLSAACGFRVFVPLLVMSIANLSGHLTLAHGFDWIGTYPALITFSNWVDSISKGAMNSATTSGKPPPT